jgi:hypothetical protein
MLLYYEGLVAAAAADCELVPGYIDGPRCAGQTAFNHLRQLQHIVVFTTTGAAAAATLSRLWRVNPTHAISACWLDRQARLRNNSNLITIDTRTERAVYSILKYVPNGFSQIVGANRRRFLAGNASGFAPL